LINNDYYLELKKYVTDARFVRMYMYGPSAKNKHAEYINECIEGLQEDSETDIITYLDNFVYDDTEYENISEYISGDFESIEKFGLHLFKGYLCNNFNYYLDKLG